MTERARPLTIKFYPDLTQSWFQPRSHTAILSLSKVILLKIWRNCLFFAEIFLLNGMAIVKQLVKALYCSQERSVREEQTE